MKTSSVLLVLSITLSTVASASEHPCSEFFEKETQAQGQVNDFDQEVRKLQAKLTSIEERIAKKMEEVAPLRSQRETLARQLERSLQDQSDLQRQLRLDEDNYLVVQNDAQRLRARLDWLNEEIRRNPGPASRPFLRESKQLEREIPLVELKLPGLRLAVAQSRVRLGNISYQIGTLNGEIAQVDVALEEHSRGLAPMNEVRTRAQQELNDTNPMFEELTRKLNKAQKHVQMCVGYEELSVKYPMALEVARDVYKQKCRSYVPVRFPTELENQAQEDVLQSVCAQ